MSENKRGFEEIAKGGRVAGNSDNKEPAYVKVGDYIIKTSAFKSLPPEVKEMHNL